MLQREITDPQLGLITVSAVNISPDLKNARIFVTSLGGRQQTDDLVRMLNDRAWHYRQELARVLTLRSVPHLKFEFDISIQRGRHLTDLIDSLAAAAKNQPSQDKS